MVIVWRVFGGIGLLLPLLALSVAGYFFVSAAPWAVPATSAVLWLVGVTWYPRARYRAWRWRLTDIALELRYGILVHRHEAVPYFRVQQIDISQGPFDRLLGLATLQVTTASASGSAGLPGIPADDAPQIRKQLLARAAVAVGDQPDEVRDAV
jgi:membrane protein YdbS with pleckstrin-like domain